MKKADDTTTLQELKELVAAFRDDRGWRKHHTPKNLAIGVALEAAELLEHFQWEELNEQNRNEIADELSDVLFNLLNLSDTLQIDITTAFLDKYERIKAKYPLEVFSKGQDAPEEYRRIKQAYRDKK